LEKSKCGKPFSNAGLMRLNHSLRETNYILTSTTIMTICLFTYDQIMTPPAPIQNRRWFLLRCCVKGKERGSKRSYFRDITHLFWKADVPGLLSRWSWFPWGQALICQYQKFVIMVWKGIQRDKLLELWSMEYGSARFDSKSQWPIPGMARRHGAENVR
jgi:hypothetical protein